MQCRKVILVLIRLGVFLNLENSRLGGIKSFGSRIIFLSMFSFFCLQYRPMESLDHLFFFSLITRSIWREILSWSKLEYEVMPWKDYIGLVSLNWKDNNLTYFLAGLSLGTTIYFIWKECNSRTFT